MKRHLMTGMALLAWTAAVAADGGVVAYEQGKVYGPMSILGEEAVTVDGHGAIIDGGGTNRCATLGPNVTLKNFTFRNGKAAFGGGVWGGRIENCVIRDCIATEYGAAVANCKARATTISGCRRPLDGSVKAAMHGGIAADSALDGVTVTGCRVELGTAVPVFGGIAANSALTGCTVTDNAFVISGDHYGLLFYGGSIAGSAITGNSVSSARSNVAAYMKVTPAADCTLDQGDVPPGPEPVPVGTDVFTGNASYVGWLRKDGVVVGTVDVKAGRVSERGSKVTVTVTPLGDKKTKLYSDYVPVGEVVTNAIPGLTLAGSIVSGTMNVGGEECEVISYNNPLKSPDNNVRQAAKLAIPTGTWTFSLMDEGGLEHPFSVTVANTAKAKFTGYQADGRKLSFSVQGVYEMESRVLHVPVSFAKKNYTSVSFLMSVSGTVASVSCVIPELAVANPPQPLKPMSDGLHEFIVPSIPKLEPGLYLNSPSGEVFTVLLEKWKFGKTAGKIAAENGVPTVKPNSRGEVSNLSALKLKCAAKTGVVTGSFRMYWMNGEKVKKDTANVYGIVIHDAVSGLSVVKKKGAFAAWSIKKVSE